MTEVELLTRKVHREKSARQQAESILEQKARELYEANEAIRKSNLELGQANSLLQLDIAERERAEQALTAKELEARLLHRAATMAADTHSFEAAMLQCLELVCRSTGWTLGHAYLKNEGEGAALIPTGLWYERNGPNHAKFRAMTEQTPFESGVGLPGQVLLTGEPVWIADLQKEVNFPRAAAFGPAYLKSAFAFPIKVGGRCAAVLEFFREDESAEDFDFLRLIRSVSEQLGRVLERKQADQTLRASEQRIRQIIDSALDAVVSIDAEGIVNDWNAQAEQMFAKTRLQAVGRHLSEMVVLMSDEGPSRQTLVDLITQSGADVLNRRTELRAMGSDGREFPIEIAVAPVQVGSSVGYSIFLRDVSDRHNASAERDKLHGELMILSRSAGMAEVATGVLHNVGNVLNSVNVSATLVADRLRASRLKNLSLAAAMINEHLHDLANFLVHDNKGRQLPAYLVKLAAILTDEQAVVLQELTLLESNIDHIKHVVNMQQSHARASDVIEVVSAAALMDEAVGLNRAALERHHVQIHREFAASPMLHTDKHKVLQILINLINNANEAMQETAPERRQLTLRIQASPQTPGKITLQVIDSGVGISAENLTRIFSHGFTTRKNGHGFGLHTASLTAKELGGSLSLLSDGRGLGATFTLELPVNRKKENVPELLAAA